MGNELRASATVAPEGVRESLLDAAKKADDIFYSSSHLDKKMKDMMGLLRKLVMGWGKKVDSARRKTPHGKRTER